MMQHLLKVGAPYVPGRTRWPEGAEYNFSAGGHELRLFFESPSEAEIKAVRKAPVHLALLVQPPIIDLVWRIDGIGDWSDCPYTWHLVPEQRRAIPETASGQQRALLQIVLVDANTGMLRAIRAVTLPPHATTLLHTAIADQANRPWTRDGYDQALHDLYARYPEPVQMARAGTVLVRAGT